MSELVQYLESRLEAALGENEKLRPLAAKGEQLDEVLYELERWKETVVEQAAYKKDLLSLIKQLNKENAGLKKLNADLRARARDADFLEARLESAELQLKNLRLAQKKWNLPVNE